MKVTFSSTHSAWSVKAPSGTLVSLTGTPSQAADGIYTIGDEGYILIDDQMLTDSIYLSISGSDYEVAAGARIAYPAEGVEVRAGSSVLPFKIGGKGGGSGDGSTHYKGTTTTPISNGSTANPITIDGESYTAVFGDVVVYGYTEFVFDGTQWSEFGRPFDTTPTSGSANAVTSDGVYRNTAGQKYYVDNAYKGEVFNNYVDNVASNNYSHAEGAYATASGNVSHAEGNRATASGNFSHAEGNHTTASGPASHSGGHYTIANKQASTAIGKYNVADTDKAHLLIVGNGTNEQNRSNILEVSETDVNINGDIKRDGVGIDDYTTTERKIGKWIDGSDLYQRTFEVTGLVVGWNMDVLGTSDITIQDVQGYVQFDESGTPQKFPLNAYANSDNHVVTLYSVGNHDVSVKIANSSTIVKAVITIKYTKPSVQANIQQTEEPTDEMR